MAKEFAEVNRFVERARQDPAVLAVILFGSAVRDAQRRQSDTDLCLVLEPRRAGRNREAMGEKRLEYLSEFDLDVQIFQRLPLYIRRRVLREGQVLFVRDEDLLYEVAYRTAQAFEDFKHTYDTYLEQITRAGS